MDDDSVIAIIANVYQSARAHIAINVVLSSEGGTTGRRLNVKSFMIFIMYYYFDLKHFWSRRDARAAREQICKFVENAVR